MRYTSETSLQASLNVLKRHGREEVLGHLNIFIRYSIGALGFNYVRIMQYRQKYQEISEVILTNVIKNNAFYKFRIKLITLFLLHNDFCFIKLIIRKLPEALS